MVTSSILNDESLAAREFGLWRLNVAQKVVYAFQT